MPFAWSALKQLKLLEFKIMLRVGCIFSLGMLLWMWG